MSKPTVAFFDFSGCEGDQLQVANLEEQLLVLNDLVEIVGFREIYDGKAEEYDIAFIEGSCVRKSDEARLKQIRERAKFVVAIGACATIGGINSLKNAQSEEKVRKLVYGKKADLFESYPARPIDAIIKVDCKIHGCPIRKEEFLEACKALLAGQKYEPPNYPVCVECKLAENICVFEKGETCVGPVTRAGCKACCVTQGAICWGCRGLVDDPNIDSHKEVLEKYGLKAEDLINKFNLYFKWQEDVNADQGS
ncbi:MAG: NADH:ubiquinone oxidoreductase [Pseudomonadota bacterium]